MSSSTINPSHARMLPYLVAATFFMEYLDTTVIATALPQMAQSFGVGPNEVSMGMSAYMLALAVLIPVSGWIADRFGSRTVFCCAIVVFTATSVLCGLSTSVNMFTAASTIACGLLTPSTPLLVILLVVFIYGLARSMQYTTLSTLAYADIAPQQMSNANSLWSTAAQMTAGMGIAFGAVSLQGALWIRGAYGSPAETLFTLDDFKWAFAAAGVMTLLSLPGYWRLARDAGTHISAKNSKR